jgi:hypothetical protein
MGRDPGAAALRRNMRVCCYFETKPASSYCRKETEKHEPIDNANSLAQKTIFCEGNVSTAALNFSLSFAITGQLITKTYILHGGA